MDRMDKINNSIFLSKYQFFYSLQFYTIKHLKIIE